MPWTDYNNELSAQMSWTDYDNELSAQMSIALRVRKANLQAPVEVVSSHIIVSLWIGEKNHGIKFTTIKNG